MKTQLVRILVVIVVVVAAVALLPPPALAQQPKEPEAPAAPVEQTIHFSAAPIEDAVRAGSGRYLLLHLRRIRAIAVLDLAQRKVAGYVPAGSDEIRIAGGASKFVVALVDKGLLQRWDLNTRQLEASVKWPAPNPGPVAMGAASEGPVLCGTVLVNLATLSPMPVAITTHDGGRDTPGIAYQAFDAGPADTVTARPDGQAFLSGIHVLSLSGDKADVYADSTIHPNWPGLQVFPIFQHLFQIQGGRSKSPSEITIPLIDDRYFIHLKYNGRARANVNRADNLNLAYVPTATVRRVSDGRVFSEPLRLEELDIVGFPPAPGLPLNRRVHFDPATGLLVTIPLNADRVCFRTVWRDLRER